MLNVICGVYSPDGGTVTFDGDRRRRMDAQHVAKLGIGRTFQNLALFRGMSVLDNVMTGRTLFGRATFLEHAMHWGRARREERAQQAKVDDILALLRLSAQRDVQVGRLPYGLQKRAELGRALAAEPKLLLLDEPMAGMSADEKEDMCRCIVDVNEQHGTTVVLIEHDLGVVMDLSDHVVVLDYGRKIGDGSPADVSTNQDVIDAYLGVAHEQL